MNRVRSKGKKVAQAHFSFINPLPKNTEEVLKKYKHIICPELNLGQLSKVLANDLNIMVESFNKIQGLPLKSSEIETKIESILGGK